MHKVNAEDERIVGEAAGDTNVDVQESAEATDSVEEIESRDEDDVTDRSTEEEVANEFAEWVRGDGTRMFGAAVEEDVICVSESADWAKKLSVACDDGEATRATAVTGARGSMDTRGVTEDAEIDAKADSAFRFRQFFGGECADEEEKYKNGCRRASDGVIRLAGSMCSICLRKSMNNS